MAVRVVKAGHQQFAGAVVPLAEVLLRLRVADAGDFAVPYPHKSVCLIVERVVQNSDVGKKHFGSTLSSHSCRSEIHVSFILSYAVNSGQGALRGERPARGRPGEKSAAKASFVLFGPTAIWYDETIRSRRG